MMLLNLDALVDQVFFPLAGSLLAQRQILGNLPLFTPRSNEAVNAGTQLQGQLRPRKVKSASNGNHAQRNKNQAGT